MRIGANTPYDWDISRAQRTFALLHALRADELTITSHTPRELIDRLIEEFPDAWYHVRTKGSRGWWPADPLHGKEWDSEQCVGDTVERLLQAGITPRILWWNEPDIELPPDRLENGQWCCDIDGYRRDAWERYRDAVAPALAAVRREWPGRVLQALAPISEGAPERSGWWEQKYRESGLLAAVDFLSTHCYIPDDQYEDETWAGRWRVWSDVGLPITINETNDDGKLYAQDPNERAQHYADYVAHLVSAGGVASVSLFHLPGGMRDNTEPSFWLLTDEICSVAGSVAREAPPVVAGGAGSMDRRTLIRTILQVSGDEGFDQRTIIMLGLAESNLVMNAANLSDPPHGSFGPFQQNIRYAPEWTGEASIPMLVELYTTDAVRATRQAMRLFTERREPGDSAVDTACRYNAPGIPPADNPNRWLYERSWNRAVQVLEDPLMAEFVLGFKAKADELGEAIVGKPLADQDYMPLKNGDEMAFQMTTTGLMVYQKKANTVRFLPGR